MQNSLSKDISQLVILEFSAWEEKDLVARLKDLALQIISIDQHSTLQIIPEVSINLGINKKKMYAGKNWFAGFRGKKKKKKWRHRIKET
jgi:hypothetical protein